MPYNQKEAAKWLGVSAQVLNSALKSGRISRCVVEVDGKKQISDLEALKVEWHARTDARKRPATFGPLPVAGVRGDDDDGLAEAARAKSRLTIAQADLAELKRDEARALLVPAAEMRRVMSEKFHVAKTKLLAIPSTAKQAIPHLTAGEVADLEDLVRDALNDLVEVP